MRLLRQLLFVLLLLLSLLSTAFAERVFSEEDYQIMIENNQNINEKLDSNEKELTTLADSQKRSEKTIQSLEQNSKTITSNNKTVQQSYEKIIEVQEIQITELKTSSTELKSWIDKAFDWINGFLWGALTIMIITYTGV